MRMTPLAAVVLGGAVAAAGAQEVVFRARVDLVTVDATVIGPDGRPVSGLGPDHFVLKVDGRSRRIVSSQFVAPPRSAEVRAAHFTSNEDTNGRLLLIAVDEAHIRRLEGRTALGAAAAFIDALDPLDRVAVNGLSRIGTVEFTRDRAALKRRLESLVGQTDPVFLQFNLGLAEAVEVADGSRMRLADVVLRECGRALTDYTSLARAADDSAARDSCPQQVEQEARAVAQHARTQARISLDALTALIVSLKPLDGPKSVLLLSEGMVLDPRLIDISELAAAAHEARVSIYALHLEVPLFDASQDRVSPTALRDFEVRGDGLSRLAGATRGAVYRLVGSDPGPFRRIATELSGYYLLAFEAEDGDRDGRLHQIDVKLAQGGGGVLRARPAFRLPPVVPSPRTREQDLVTLLRAVHPATELPVRVATYTYAEPGSPRVRVVVSAETDPAGGPAAEVLMGYVLMDERRVIAASGAHLAADGRHAFSAVVTPGLYSLRVAGIDPLGRKGLIERPFTAAVVGDAGLRLSDLILAPVPVRADTALAPFVDRVSQTRVTAYVELSSDDLSALSAVDVRFEVAPETSGEARVSAAAVIDRGRGPLAVARATLSLAGLPAGRYVAHARIVRAGQPERLVTRPFTYDP